MYMYEFGSLINEASGSLYEKPNFEPSFKWIITNKPLIIN